MRLSKTLTLFCLSLFISFTTVVADELPVTILYPQENLLHNELTLNAIVRVQSKDVNSLKIMTSTEQKTVDINGSKAIYCRALSLRLGDNKITIRSYSDGKVVDEQSRRVYVTSPIHQEYKYPPKKYQRQFFHTNANESECKTCHDMSVNEVPGVAFIDVTESNCYECHNQLTKEKYGHAPAVNWLCTECHNGTVGSDNKEEKGRSKYLVPKPVNTLCFDCHMENKELWDSYRYRHEPLDSGRCNKCHNSHSTPYNMFVRKNSDHICLGCHSDKHMTAKRHGSDCAGTSEGKRCIICHTPHASGKKFFLRQEGEKVKREKIFTHDHNPRRER